jgi:predicted amidohydrolase
MKKTTLPVALIQERNHGDAEANLAVIEQRVAEAARRGARLVLLQELHNGAYFCQHQNVCEFELAEAFPDREIVQVDCRPLIWQNGSLHCLTMQLPQGVLA